MLETAYLASRFWRFSLSIVLILLGALLVSANDVPDAAGALCFAGVIFLFVTWIFSSATARDQTSGSDRDSGSTKEVAEGVRVRTGGSDRDKVFVCSWCSTQKVKDASITGTKCPECGSEMSLQRRT